jgi:YidC/Oxa1 family membrane protein insertase
MRTELRFLLAIGLMIVVLVGTNLLFPPIPPEDPGLQIDSTLVQDPGNVPADSPTVDQAPPVVPQVPDTELAGPAVEPVAQDTATADTEADPQAPAVPEQLVIVETPLYRLTFTTHGARLLSAELPGFESFTGSGPVQLVPDGEVATLGQRLLVAGDTVDMRRAPFEPSAPSVEVSQGGGAETLRFTYDHPTSDFGMEVAYTFVPEEYGIVVSGQVRGVESGTLFTDLGSGVAFNEVNVEEEGRLTAYVTNHIDRGIRAVPLRDVEGLQIDDGPFFWAVFKTKFFMFGALAGTEPEASERLGGLLAAEHPAEHRASLTVTQPFGPEGRFAYRLYAGPQDFKRLSAYGHDLEDANPYGWKFMRPVIQPFTGLIITFLNWMHDRFNLAYGWVLILFGVMMRVVFFPLYHRSMKAQLKNMAVQPLLQEIQKTHKDTPEKMQKELMKLYKEHGFNPLAGCLPMLLPWPVLVALFFVFQNTIELRGVPFLWLPDLSLADPYYILPIFLGLSMFLLQWVGFRSMDQVNPQMKMMMWFMPIFLVFIFFRLPSGLNLYYATANIATLPQQFWIANERKKARADAPKPAVAVEPEKPKNEEQQQPRRRKKRASRKR